MKKIVLLFLVLQLIPLARLQAKDKGETAKQTYTKNYTYE